MKLFLYIITILLSFGLTANAMPVDIAVNSHILATDTSPQINDGTVLAPVRIVANALGCSDVTWYADTKTVILNTPNTRIEIVIGSPYAYVNDTQYSLISPAQIVNDRTLVPLRFIAETLGAQVDWNSENSTVIITKNDVVVPDEYKADYDENDISWLAKIIHAEAQGESDLGKLAVGNVVLNRVDSADFPNTIYEVIFDTNYGVQFTPVANGTIYNIPSNASYTAAKEVLHGENVIGECLYFCNPTTSVSHWIMTNRPYFTTIGKHNFYL